MLVLGRKVGDSVDVIIDGVVVAKITIVDIQRGKVRLGFTAPKHVAFERDDATHREARPVPA